jgi:amidase
MRGQKEVYHGVAEKIREIGGFVGYPIDIPEAVHSNNTLKHNGLSMREEVCRLALWRWCASS